MEAALIARIGADLTDLRSKMDQAGGIVGGFKDHVSKLGPAIAGAFSVSAIVAFGKAAIDAAGQAVDGENRLLTALRGREDVQKRLIEQAEDLHGRTLFEDDEIIQQQALLAAMGRNEDQIKKVIEASVQLAAVTGAELSVAVEALNRTYEGTEKGLKSLDPTLHGFTEVQLKSGEVIDLVRQKYEGFAESLTKVGSGPLQEFNKHINDLTEDMGRNLLPVLNRILDAFYTTKQENFEAALGKYGSNVSTDELPSWLKSVGEAAAAAGINIRTYVSEQKSLNELLEKYRQLTGQGNPVGPSALPPLGPFGTAPVPNKARAAGQAGGDPTEGITADMDYLKQMTKDWFTKEYPEVVVGSLEEVANFKKEIEQSQTDFEKAQYQDRLDAFTEAERRKAETAAQMAETLGANFGLAASGARTLEQAIAASSRAIVNHLKQTAFAGLIARIMETVPFPFNLGLIAAGSAFLESMFAKLAVGGGGGAGGIGGGGSAGITRRENSSLYSPNTQTIQIEGKAVITGTQLEVIFGRQGEFNLYTKPAFVPIGG